MKTQSSFHGHQIDVFIKNWILMIPTASFGNLRTTCSIPNEALTHPLHFLNSFQLNATGVRKTVFGRGLHKQKQKLSPEPVLWMYSWSHLLKSEAGFSTRELCSYFSSTSHSSDLICTAGPTLPPQGCRVTGFRWAVFYSQAAWHTRGGEEKVVKNLGSGLVLPFETDFTSWSTKMIIWPEFTSWVWYSHLLGNRHSIDIWHKYLTFITFDIMT